MHSVTDRQTDGQTDNIIMPVSPSMVGYDNVRSAKMACRLNYSKPYR